MGNPEIVAYFNGNRAFPATRASDLTESMQLPIDFLGQRM